MTRERLFWVGLGVAAGVSVAAALIAFMNATI